VVGEAGGRRGADDPDGAAGTSAPAPSANRLAHRRLYLCTPDRPDLEAFLVACIRGGVDVVQLRDKHLEARDVLARARLARRVCADHGVPFVLNDRPDLALYVGADGVHVGQDDAPVDLARRILGPDAIVGLSTHDPGQLAAAVGESVDYLSAGPVEETPTKPGRPGTGTGYLTQAVAASPVPVFVTGGVTPDRVAALAEAGARHFVVVRYLTGAAQPEDAATALRVAIDRALVRVEQEDLRPGPG
jgi:thiamine-phosphate pyrophosphorylase